MTVTCLSFRPVVQHTLRGFADLKLDPPGLTLRACPVHVSAGRRWVGLPAAPQIEDGRVRTDERGKTLYTAVAVLTEDARPAFTEAAVAAVVAACPTAFGEDAP